MEGMKCPKKSYRRYRKGRLLGTRGRNYRLEHACYHSLPGNARKSNARHRARAMLTRLGHVSRGDHRVIHHKNQNALDNRLSNLLVLSSARHRALHSRPPRTRQAPTARL